MTLMADVPADPNKAKFDTILSNLELATGEILAHDKQLGPLITKMRQQLFALRALLGVERPH
jgi:hypothetical protein